MAQRTRTTAPQRTRKAIPEPPKGKETLEQMLIRTRGYGLGKSDPKIPYDGRFDRARYWSAWGKIVRAGTPIVGIRSEHF